MRYLELLHDRKVKRVSRVKLGLSRTLFTFFETHCYDYEFRKIKYRPACVKFTSHRRIQITKKKLINLFHRVFFFF